jgi:D-serine deaminase-like pyridoxal phosphate-dependent protein
MSFTKNAANNRLEWDTPCLLIDLNKLKYNLNSMAVHAKNYGVSLRPHCKTHKCSKIAKLQIEYGAIGISVAKVSEAEVLIANNIPNVLITSPVVTRTKLEKLMQCFRQSPSMMVVCDEVQNATELNEIGAALNQHINVLIDVDPGIGRTGVSSRNVEEFARSIKEFPWIRVQGLQCYAGNLQHIQDYGERTKRSLQTMEIASGLFRKVKSMIPNMNILSGSGTGTFDIDVQASEVTEIQPGSYTVMDVQYETISSKETLNKFAHFQNAMTLMSSVISANRAEHVTVDAGTKAIYFDPSYKPRIISHENLNYDWGGFGDEHGKITSSKNGSLPPVGECVEMIVPHCDPTINLFDRFYICDQGAVIDVWEIDMRGKSQ